GYPAAIQLPSAWISAAEARVAGAGGIWPAVNWMRISARCAKVSVGSAYDVAIRCARVSNGMGALLTGGELWPPPQRVRVSASTSPGSPLADPPPVEPPPPLAPPCPLPPSPGNAPPAPGAPDEPGEPPDPVGPAPPPPGPPPASKVSTSPRT